MNKTTAENQPATEQAKDDAKDQKLKDGQDDVNSKDKKSLAKAGKRSAKALKEADELSAKEARKQSSAETTEQVPKKAITQKTRSKLERRSKNYRNSSKKIDTNKLYNLKEALALAVQTSTVKFDASLEIHIKLNADPKLADQNIRGSLMLPHGTGKKVRVAVFAPSEESATLKKAGADIAGEDEIINLLGKGKIEFDVLIAHPKLMSQLAKYAKLLGPKGLMPNPKSGTVASNLEKAVKEAKGGRIEYRIDKQGIIHTAIGKVSFQPDQLLENAKALIDTLYSTKPATIKGAFISSISIASTMGPGIKVDISSTKN